MSPRAQGRVVTFGETLGLLRAPKVGPLRSMPALELGFAGAESNVAIGLARLGHAVSWRGCVGDDELGRLVVGALRGEGVDVNARVVDDVPTALMLREHRTSDVTHVSYYRSGLAGSRLDGIDVEDLALRAGDLLHVTGITPALGAGPAAAVRRAVERARAVGARVSFDVNHRAALWSASAAAAPLRSLAASADILFAGPEELALVVGPGAGAGLGTAGGDESDTSALGSSAPSPAEPPFARADGWERAFCAAQALGPSEVVLKLGAAGATARDGMEAASARAPQVVAVDPIGAGDAFVAGYLSAVLDGLPLADRLRRACAVGAFAVTSHGDWESLPRRAELDLLDHGPGTTLR
jgi:2-dehydro-3-deoxygluconokinase